jgi:hypothetical protein
MYSAPGLEYQYCNPFDFTKMLYYFNIEENNLIPGGELKTHLTQFECFRGMSPERHMQCGEGLYDYLRDPSHYSHRPDVLREEIMDSA